MFPLALLGLAGGGGGSQGGPGGFSLPLLLQFLMSQQPQNQKVQQPNQKLIKAQQPSKAASGTRAALGGTTNATNSLMPLLAGNTAGLAATLGGAPQGGNGVGGLAPNSTPGLNTGANSGWPTGGTGGPDNGSLNQGPFNG